jgi:cGMP-dependent protein kinase
MKKVQMLHTLSPDNLMKMVQALRPTTYENGQTILEENVAGDTFYLINTGIVNVMKEGIFIRKMSNNDYFGERSILFNDARSATVVAEGQV